jgi:formate dehydrogenase major subunit
MGTSLAASGDITARPAARTSGGPFPMSSGPSRVVQSLLQRWPAWRDIRDWRRGTPFDRLGLGDTAISPGTLAMRPRIEDADAAVPGICPYCGVGCSQLLYVAQGKLIGVEGNPSSPINGGTLCPRGAATYGMLVNPARVTTVKYRAPHSDRWEERPLDWAMDRIARLVKDGATLHNEENYLIKKLLGGGLGLVWIENQARV